MPKILVKNLFNKALSYSDNTKSVLGILQEHYVDWMHACGGKGRCTTCKMRVLEGMENLSPMTNFEEGFSKQGRLSENERLTCQTTCLGDVVIEVPESGKMPHIKYSD
ncbi:MAG: 2Fe-2S iron-sulfur cluster-binding protein [Bacteroidota bacterium]